jgi:hypothetical protein
VRDKDQMLLYLVSQAVAMGFFSVERVFHPKSMEGASGQDLSISFITVRFPAARAGP